MESIERSGLPPPGKQGGSITQENVQRFAVGILEDYLHDFLSGPLGYFPDGGKRRIDGILDGIYSNRRNRPKTLVDKLYELQDRVYDSEQREYFEKFIEGMIALRKDWENRIDESVISDPYKSSPEINPDRSYSMNGDRGMMIVPDADNNIPKPIAEPPKLPLRWIRP